MATIYVFRCASCDLEVACASLADARARDRCPGCRPDRPRLARVRRDPGPPEVVTVIRGGQVALVRVGRRAWALAGSVLRAVEGASWAPGTHWSVPDDQVDLVAARLRERGLVVTVRPAEDVPA